MISANCKIVFLWVRWSDRLPGFPNFNDIFLFLYWYSWWCWKIPMKTKMTFSEQTDQEKSSIFLIVHLAKIQIRLVRVSWSALINRIISNHLSGSPKTKWIYTFLVKYKARGEPSSSQCHSLVVFFFPLNIETSTIVLTRIICLFITFNDIFLPRLMYTRK